MITSVRVMATLVEDNTGIKSKIPVLLTEQGELTALTDYLLYAEQEGRSKSWMNQVIQATQRFLEYLEANVDCFSEPIKLFQTFVKRLCSGTIGHDGLDSSHLYWLPVSVNTSRQWINALTQFTDWLVQQNQTEPINPLVEANTHQKRINYAAWFRKNQHDFLVHIKNRSIHLTLQQARFIRGRQPHPRVDSDAVAFSEADFPKFFSDGIGGSQDSKVSLRDQLILILMHGGGLRVSEALSLWITDVFEDPFDQQRAMVRIYHPEDGKAPLNWKGQHGETNRSAYLLQNYGLIPRNREQGTQYLGWKAKTVDHKENYLQVHWFPSDYGRLFMKLWRDYLYVLTGIQRHHPYAFIAFRKGVQGNPYTQAAFNDSYQKGLQRIGIQPSKTTGYCPHGHRHAYGRRLRKAEVNPVMIKKCLHHASIHSQAVYTAPSLEEVSRLLDQASECLNLDSQSSSTNTDWKTLMTTGFSDIDPDGLFSGQSPILG